MLYERQANAIFQDKESTLWFCFAQNGVSKLSVTNLSVINNIYGLHYINDINYSHGALLFFDAGESKIVLLKNSLAKILSIEGTEKFSRVYITSKGLFGIASTEIYKLVLSGNLIILHQLTRRR